jgi:hypothetical protein
MSKLTADIEVSIAGRREFPAKPGAGRQGSIQAKAAG